MNFKILYAIILSLLMSISTFATERVGWFNVSSSGMKTQSFNLKPGFRYYIVASGSAYYGNWHQNGRSLNNDACYEYTAKGFPVALPVLKNNLGVNVCGEYSSAHIYTSSWFSVGSPTKINFWLFDSDYRDNVGLIKVEIYGEKIIQKVIEKVTSFWKVGRVGGGTTCTINLLKEPSQHDRSRYGIYVNPWGICPIPFVTWVSQGSSITFRDGNGVVTGKVNRVKKGYWEGNGMNYKKERFRFYIIRGGVTPP